MRRGFTLIELLVTVVLGAMIMLMIAGVMSSAIRSWESVQTRVSQNYNRRNVLDLVKRQSSSLFFRQDANDLAQGNDALQVQTELESLADVLLLRTLQPPLAVGLFGNWGNKRWFLFLL